MKTCNNSLSACMSLLPSCGGIYYYREPLISELNGQKVTWPNLTKYVGQKVTGKKVTTMYMYIDSDEHVR